MAAISLSNPEGVHAPQAAYSHAALVEGPGRRLVISAQAGVMPDGRISAQGNAQIDQAFQNLEAVLRANGMEPANVVKLTAFLTDRMLVTPWRRRRDSFLAGHAAAATLVLVSGFADPRFVVEIEAEAVAA
ncbi:RidA family protein [Roseomonas elaeocarpi]|uniref:RidA family protein n=1 Tax=Roseomonas elaeocarpi TaxID=907779 RepID=A0ABV6JRX1_9PROT